MPRITRDLQLRVIVTACALAEERKWVALADVAAMFGITVDVVRAVLEPVLYPEWRDSFGELRVSHEQNLILADVAQSELYTVWQKARELGLATPNIGLLTNIISCPGGDFCSLANAASADTLKPSALKVSLPVAARRQRPVFGSMPRLLPAGSMTPRPPLLKLGSEKLL